LFFVSTSYASNDQKPAIIYFKGTCSAGKSTLIDSLSLQWKDLEIVDEDVIVIREFPRAVEKRFPEEYACLVKAIAKDNLYHALRTKHVLFKKTATLEECEKAQAVLKTIKDELNQTENIQWKNEVNEGIRCEMVELIQKALGEGNFVLLDSWYYSAEQVQEIFPDVSVIKVMLYCDFPVAYQRLLKRNRDAFIHENLREKRFVSNLIISFCSIYKIDDSSCDPIQEVSIAALEESFSMAANTLSMLPDYKTQIFNYGELSRPQFEEYQDRLLQDCRDKTKTYYISPRIPQDLIIDNTSGDTQKAIGALDEMFHFMESTK
jgi:deoxyadenosine/deoxycytidine kinase